MARFRVPLDRLDEVRDEVVAALEFDVDPAQPLSTALRLRIRPLYMPVPKTARIAAITARTATHLNQAEHPPAMHHLHPGLKHSRHEGCRRALTAT